MLYDLKTVFLIPGEEKNSESNKVGATEKQQTKWIDQNHMNYYHPNVTESSAIYVKQLSMQAH